MIALKVKNYFEFFVYKQKLIKTVLNIDDQIAMFDSSSDILRRELCKRYGRYSVLLGPVSAIDKT